MVMKYDGGYCQRCKGNYDPDPNRRKKLTKAVLVHHHFHVEDHPEWRYRMWVTVNGEKQRNLWSLCTACHEYIHRDTHKPKTPFQKRVEADAFSTKERWD